MQPLVSIITIFLNEAKFIREAVQSVFGQTYRNWELLLIDDGSSDASSDIARSYAQEYPGRVRYLEHAGHVNRGMSASRNLGLAHALGPYLAFLDGDDVWLPDKLQRQVRLLEDNPAVGMTYGATKVWHSWTGAPEDETRDWTYGTRVTTPTFFEPPVLLGLFLADKIPMHCTASAVCRTEVVRSIGGWEESFRGMHEDQVFFAKMCLETTMLLTDECLDVYRQHPDSACAVADRSGETPISTQRFFRWLEDHLDSVGMRGSETWQILQREKSAYASRIAT